MNDPAKLLSPYLPAAQVKTMGPDLARYESEFITYLAKHKAEEVIKPDPDPLTRVGWYYYDRGLILFREAMRTGDATMRSRATTATRRYRDVLPDIDYPVNWIFPRSIAYDWMATGNTRSLDWLAKVATDCKAPYYLDRLKGGIIDGESADNRIQGRVLETFVVAHFAAVPVKTPNDFEDYRSHAVMARWCLEEILKSQNSYGNFAWKFRQKSPFMTGLLLESLIFYYETFQRDARIFGAVKRALDFIWRYWRATPKAFIYDPGFFDISREEGLAPAPDLNMLVAPAFAWAYRQTKDPLYKTRGDLVLKGAVEGAWLDGQKQFNQQYYLGHQYAAWRG